MPESNAEIARSAYEAFIRGDIDVAFRNLDDDCTWRAGSPELPSGGVFHGKQEILGRWLAEFTATFQDFRMTCDEVLGIDDRVIVTGSTRATVAGQEIKAPYCHLWTYRDGKAVEASFFTYEAAAVLALQKAHAITS
jgi:ketosteroid isomerase-like protein